MSVAPTYGELSIVGSGVSLSTGTLSWQGRISITLLGEAGISPIDVSGTVSASGQLAIDASAYNGGAGSIHLIKYSSIDNSDFGPANIVLSALAGELMAEVITAQTGLSLMVQQGAAQSHILDTPTTIVFGSGGVTPVLIGTDLVIAETAEILIDGTAFNSTTAEGGSFFTLFELQILEASLTRKYAIHGTFDFIKIRLVGFSKHLWFEIVYQESAVTLKIKYVTDFSEHANRGQYPTGWEHPSQPNQDLFPAHSWDNTPRWISVQKTYPHTQDELNDIANQRNAVVHMGELDGVRAVKAMNPDAKTLCHVSSAICGETQDDGFDEDNWLQHKIDADGDRVPILTRGVCRRLHNHTVPEMREWWINKALATASQPEWDGVFIDAPGEDPLVPTSP